MTTQVECPHCRTRNIISNVEQWTCYHILKCGEQLDEDLGCEKPFAVRTTVEVKAEVFTLSKWEQKP